MARMLVVMIRFIRDARGATAIEYALIVALIGVGLVTVLGLLHDDIWAVFTNGIASALTKAAD